MANKNTISITGVALSFVLLLLSAKLWKKSSLNKLVTSNDRRKSWIDELRLCLVNALHNSRTDRGATRDCCNLVVFDRNGACPKDALRERAVQIIRQICRLRIAIVVCARLMSQISAQSRFNLSKFKFGDKSRLTFYQGPLPRTERAAATTTTTHAAFVLCPERM